MSKNAAWEALQEALLAKCTDLAEHLGVDGIAVVAGGARMLVGVGWQPPSEGQEVHGLAAGDRLAFLFLVSGEVGFMDPAQGLVEQGLVEACEWAASEAEAFAASGAENAALLPVMSDDELEKLDAL